MLLHQFDPTTRRDVLVLDLLDATGQPVPFVRTPGQERSASFSPNGKWVTYVQTTSQGRNEGRNEVYVEPYPGPGRRDAVSVNGGTEPVWSPEGSQIFFRSGADLGGPLPTAFRRALEGFSTEQLRNAIVPLGRLIFGRPEALPRLAALDPERTLLMCGALDIPRPPAETTRMAELIGCEQVIVPDAGHISNLEQPAFVTRALEAWLERQIGR